MWEEIKIAVLSQACTVFALDLSTRDPSVLHQQHCKECCFQVQQHQDFTLWIKDEFWLPLWASLTAVAYYRKLPVKYCLGSGKKLRNNAAPGNVGYTGKSRVCLHSSNASTSTSASKLQTRSRLLDFKAFLVLLSGVSMSGSIWKAIWKVPGVGQNWWSWPEASMLLLAKKKIALVEHNPGTKLFILLLCYPTEQASQHRFKNSTRGETNHL